jgi:uncharacterized membrane protein YgdD (TMEM256/DUF423 family)
MQKAMMICAVVFAMLANGLGAFAAHALKGKISNTYLATFHTGVQYQFYHSLALLMVAILMFHISGPWLLRAGILFIIGMCLFSGSLYLFSITGIRTFGFVTPIGGITLLVAWLFLLIAVAKT